MERGKYYYKVASPEYIRQASRVFDEELARQVKGKLEAGHVYQLGYPGELLQAAGFPDNRIELLASHLTKKSQQENHSDWQKKKFWIGLVQPASQASFRRPIQNLILSQRYSIISEIQRSWTIKFESYDDAEDTEDFKSGRKDKDTLVAKYYAKELENSRKKNNGMKR